VPELPEVETVRRGLHRNVLDREIASIEIFHPRTSRRQPGGSQEIIEMLTGAVFTTTKRRGKFLWLPTTEDDALLAHLGMSGQLLLSSPGEPDEKHLRARIRFADSGTELRFVDQRTFGYLYGARDGADLPDLVEHIAPDPLEAVADPALMQSVVDRLSRNVEIKRLLLDQTAVSGVGNIYADEALWRAQIHGRVRGADLEPSRREQLITHAQEVMMDALAAGGTSFDALYVGVDGEQGWFERALDAYGRVGLPCGRCGTLIQRAKWGGRSAHWCPQCQVL